MRRLKLLVVITISAMAGAAAALIAQEKVLHSTVFEWTSAGAKPNAWGAVRQVVRSRTPTLDELEIHVSTLNPGQSPHEPHQHQHEELLIVKQGTLETFQNSETRRAGEGDIIFQASNERHNVRNVGKAPAVYYVIGWTVPGAPK